MAKGDKTTHTFKKKLLLGSKRTEMPYNEPKYKFNKDFRATQNLEKLINSIGSQPITPSSNINGLAFTSNNIQFTKSPRLIEGKETKKKYISPRNKREKSKKSATSKSKGQSSNNRKGSDKRYFDYPKHNESANYYDSKRGGGLSGINISIQEVEGKKNKPCKKPQYGTGNMSHILSLLNDKRNPRTENSTFIEGSHKYKSQTQQRYKGKSIGIRHFC